MTDSDANVELWPLKTVLAKTGMGKTFIYREIKANRFPKQVPVGGKSVRWASTDVQRWIDAQIARSKLRSG